MPFSLVLQVFQQGFLQEISHFDGKEWPNKAGEITEPSWTYREQDKTVVNIISFDFRVAAFFKRPGLCFGM